MTASVAMGRESSNYIISAQPHHCDVDVQERFQTGRKSGWTGKRMISPLFTSSAARGPWLLPPPTWKIVYRPHANSKTQWQKIPVPVPASAVFICFHTYKTISGSSSPHVAPAEQLRCWITGSASAESFPVCSTTEEKITHSIISSNFPKVFTMLPFSVRGSTPTKGSCVNWDDCV